MADLVPRLWEMSEAPGQHVEDRAVWAAAAAHIAGLRAERDRLREALRTIQAVAVMTQNDHASQHRLDWLREIEERAREALGPEVSDG